jgi:hypothetical protein
MNCQKYRNNLMELAVDPANAPESVKSHVAACTSCHDDLLSLQATLSLLDNWSAPEVSPFFDTRMAARLREQRSAPPAGWMEQLRDRIQYLSNLRLRPLMAGALATCIMIGGGTYAGLTPPPVAPSATITDLKLMDKNDQALQQMDRLLQDDDNSGTTSNSNLNP